MDRNARTSDKKWISRPNLEQGFVLESSNITFNITILEDVCEFQSSPSFENEVVKIVEDETITVNNLKSVFDVLFMDRRNGRTSDKKCGIFLVDHLEQGLCAHVSVDAGSSTRTRCTSETCVESITSTGLKTLIRSASIDRTMLVKAWKELHYKLDASHATKGERNEYL
ncbi:hypothetical protein AVEN_40496-1 [Araneus ventricosus]|uniref:Uncharacterized protein n=1 Tax=Araneus ventricosus TaxID=182803 RepID=A0A4Y2IKP7_ARAVE|nr:hypothetical protein AVEN_40496-1 [Araneus ventricosus]